VIFHGLRHWSKSSTYCVIGTFNTSSYNQYTVTNGVLRTLDSVSIIITAKITSWPVFLSIVCHVVEVTTGVPNFEFPISTFYCNYFG
jgi:hypothetical protein